MSYVYIKNKSEPSGSAAAYTVGFYRDDGKRLVWEAESDHSTSYAAAARAASLNGGALSAEQINMRFERLEHGLEELAEAVLRMNYAKDLHNLSMLEALSCGDWAEFQRLVDAEYSD